jgi:MFS family permease
MQLLLPLFLIQVQGRTSGNAGLVIGPLAVSLALISPLAGRMSDRIGSRNTCLVGMAAVALAGLSLAGWTAQTATWVIVATHIVLGSGMGLVQSPTANAVTLVVGRERLGVALGIFNMLRFVSGTLGATLFGAILERGGLAADGLRAFRIDFYLLAAVAAVAAVLALKMPAAPRRAAVAAEAAPGLAGD